LPNPPEEFKTVLTSDDIPQDVLKRYNQKALHIFQNVSLMRCPHCNRTFNMDALRKHIYSCKGKGSGPDPFASQKKKVDRPRGIMCYI